MSSALAILAAAGGGVTLIAGVVVTVRAIFRLVSATEDNTEALHEVRDEVKDLKGKLDGYETRISRLEGGRRR